MIYAKNNYVPLTHNRYEQQFEYMFVFSKGKPKTFNPIKMPCKTFGNTNVWDYKNASESENYAIRRGKGDQPREYKVQETKMKPNIWFYSIGLYANKENKDKFKHPAIFPIQLAKDHIVSWSNENDVVLDPMCGSGTTCVAAKELNRNFIGFDISSEYLEIGKKRLGIDTL